jgi:hypothetical protein
MMRVSAYRSRILAGGLIVAFLILVTPVPVAAQTQAKSYARQGSLQGTVYSEGMKAKIANAIVKIRNLNTQKEYTSLPTDAKGGYRILMIEEGWYTLGVTTAAGDFNLNYGVYIKAGEMAKLSVEVLPGGMLEGRGAGSGGKKSFFSTPGGILLIVAAVGGAGFAVYTLTKESEASPVI